MFQISIAMLKQAWTSIVLIWSKPIKMLNLTTYRVPKSDFTRQEVCIKGLWSMICSIKATHHRISMLISKWIGFSMIF